MVDADRLRIVFHVHGAGFVMPVANLLAICGEGEDSCQINNCEYRFLGLNRVVEDPDFTLCGLKVSGRLA